MSKEAIATATAPAAIGPYSQGMRTRESLFTAGQIALDRRRKPWWRAGFNEQTAQVFENLKAIVEAAGSSLDRVVKATVFLKDFNDFAADEQGVCKLPCRRGENTARADDRGSVSACRRTCW